VSILVFYQFARRNRLVHISCRRRSSSLTVLLSDTIMNVANAAYFAQL